MAHTCRYCGRETENVGGDVIYPHRRDLYEKRFALCRPCGAYVGRHKDTGDPFGEVANAELRTIRMKVHAAFDPIWKSGRMKRNHAYGWLSDITGIPRERCHVGMMDVDDCKRCLAALAKEKKDV